MTLELTGETPIIRPNIPCQFKTKSLTVGSLLSFHGFLPKDCKSFILDLKASQKDIAFHASARIHNKTIVRNSCEGGQWRQEEVTSNLGPLHPGHPFTCMVLVTKPCYKLAFNGHHVADFTHRIPLEKVNMISIRHEGTGKPEIHSVDLESNSVATVPHIRFTATDTEPEAADVNSNIAGRRQTHRNRTEKAYIYQPKVPYLGSLPDTLSPGYCIYASVIPNLDAEEFVVNLRVGQEETGDIGFHMSMRMHYNVVVFNSWERKGWQGEETVRERFPFQAGVHKDIVLKIGKDGIQVFIDNVFYHFFKQRIQPARLNCLEVKGDVRLLHVRAATPEGS